ncbi:MAG: lipopolysaccharide biosynthesis protein [Verrucomicrobia bacterium]|nr:lipopolysaccharide biosynthesis protein [Verrucomicrobiota bacterium]
MPTEQLHPEANSISGESGRTDGSPRNPPRDDLKRRTLRGALVSTLGQGATFVLRLGSMMALARLLAPEQFGLVSMVTACTGILDMFRDFGLSMATVQRATISHAQLSMLFWINLGVGAFLATICAAAAPVLVAFYHEPRLLWIGIVVGFGFLFNGAAAQHRAMLQRDMRFSVLTALDVISFIVSTSVGVAMAATERSYWALVVMNICPALVNMLGIWAAYRWTPGPPCWRTDVWAQLRFGGTVTLDGVLAFITYNADKVLIGRFWGSQPLGIYGRAYQLVNIPTANLNSTVSLVAFPALSRLQNDPERFKNYFLKGYGFFLFLVMPITVGCALYAEDIVQVFLGSKWSAAAPACRLLAPTILTFALLNPLSWLLLSTGRAMRSLHIGLIVAPAVILGELIGLPYGPGGVAAGLSITTALLVLPVICWATHKTPVTAAETIKVVMLPFFSILIAAGCALAAWNFLHLITSPLLRLIAANGVLFSVYFVVFWFVMDQKEIYFPLLQEIGLGPRVRRGKPVPSASSGL